jgi:hypothetical protein
MCQSPLEEVPYYLCHFSFNKLETLGGSASVLSQSFIICSLCNQKMVPSKEAEVDCVQNLDVH